MTFEDLENSFKNSVMIFQDQEMQSWVVVICHIPQTQVKVLIRSYWNH